MVASSGSEVHAHIGAAIKDAVTSIKGKFGFTKETATAAPANQATTSLLALANAAPGDPVAVADPNAATVLAPAEPAVIAATPAMADSTVVIATP